MKRNKAIGWFITPLLAIGLFALYLKRKAKTAENLRFEFLNLGIDKKKTNLSRIYFNIKLRAINSETENINIKLLNINLFINDNNIGNILNQTPFVVPKNSQTDINLSVNFSTLSAGSIIYNIVKNVITNKAIKFTAKFDGFADTDLGRFPINIVTPVNIDF